MDIETKKQILHNIKELIEVSQNRGCWKAPEMRSIGFTYEKLCLLIKEVDLEANPPKVEEVS